MQWTPWRKIPDFGGVIDVGWIPQQPVFFKGKLLVKVDEVIADPPAARVVKEAPPPAPSAPLSAAERSAVRLGVRRDFLDAVSAACGSKFPEHAAAYKRDVQAWRASNEAGLKQANELMISRTSREDAKAMGPLIDEEKKTLQAWQTGKLGISMQKAPTMADCDKLTGSLDALPATGAER